MLILLTIFLLIITPLAMLILHLLRPRFSIQGFLVVLAALAGWIMILLVRSHDPQIITLLVWTPESLFPDSPSLLIDRTSWYFSLALMSLSFGVIITSISQLGQSPKSQLKHIPDQDMLTGEQEIPAHKEPLSLSNSPGFSLVSNWYTWGGILFLTSFGITAVAAGNMLTLLLAWAALDVVELVILMGQVMDSKVRERIVIAFTARMAGIGVLLLTSIIPWSQGNSLSFANISQSTSVFLILAAGLRLGVLPLHLPYLQVLPLRRGLGTILRLVPIAASYILLVRVAAVGVSGAVTPYLLGFTAVAGIYAAINWFYSRDELAGRSYWLLGSSSLVVASSVLNLPAACIAWSIASILSAGVVLSMTVRQKQLAVIAILVVYNLSALPFSPTWQGTALFQYAGLIPTSISAPIFYLLAITLLLIQSFLLAGFIRHVFRDIYPAGIPNEYHIERWVWFLYPFGLAIIIMTHFFIGVWLYPGIIYVTILGWSMGLVATIIASFICYFAWRNPKMLSTSTLNLNNPRVIHILSLEWLYRLFWRLFRFLSRVIALFSTILEGDGGILWALVLFALIFVFLQR